MEEKETTKENTENLQGVGLEEEVGALDVKVEEKTEDSGTGQKEETEGSDKEPEKEAGDSGEKAEKKKKKKKKKKKNKDLVN